MATKPTNDETPPEVAPAGGEALSGEFEKVKLKVSDEHALIMDPRQLVMACAETNPLYQGLGPDHESYKVSADAPVDLLAAEAFARFGFVGGAIEARKIGTQAVIEDGRQRMKEAVVATELRATDRDPDAIAARWGFDPDSVKALLKGAKAIPAGPPVLVRVFLNQDDALSAGLKSVMLNRHRRTMGAYEEALEIKAMKRLGAKDHELKVAYGFETVDTIKNRLKLLEAAPEVIAELQAGKITNSDALRLVTFDAPTQVKKLANIPKKDPTKPKSRRAKADAAKAKATGKKATAATAATGKSTGTRKPTSHNVVQILDEIEEKTPAWYALRWREGLVGIATAAEHMGLSKESPVYRHLKDKENEAKANS